MSVDAFARQTAAKVADLASILPGRGSSMVALPYGGSVWDLGGGYRDAVFATAHGSVEAAHARAVATGKSRVIVNGIAWVADGTVTTFNVPIEFMGGATCRANGFSLNFAAGFRADDYDSIFLASDAARLTFPPVQRLTPFHFGAKGNYVSSSSPGTDDGDALNAWAAELCWRVLPPARYGTTKTVFWNGAETVAANAMYRGLRAEVGAEIIQRTDNIPVLTFYGSRGEWRFPKLSYMNVQPTTNYGAVAALCAGYPGAYAGFYINQVSQFYTSGGACGVFFPRAINSTLAAAAAANASTITVASAFNDYTGSTPWTPGMWVQIKLASGSYHVTRIAAVNGAVLTLGTPLPGAANNGAVVAVSTTLLESVANPTTTATMPARFSNTWTLAYIEYPTRAGWVDTALGTQDTFVNRYINGTYPTNQSLPVETLTYAIYENFRNGDAHLVTNIEHFNILNDAWYIAGDNVQIDALHFEALRLKGSNGSFSAPVLGGSPSGLLAGPVAVLQVGTVQVTYCAMLGEDLSAPSAIFVPRANANPTNLGGNKGIWRIGILNTQKSFITPGIGLIARDVSNNQTRLDIGNWQYTRDSGLYPTGQLTSPVNWSGLVKLGNILPEGVVAFRFDADLTVTTAQDMYPSNKGQFRITKIAYTCPTKAVTAATAGVWNEPGAVNLVSAAGNTALAPLTGKLTVVEPGLHANEANKLRTAGSRVYFKCAAAEAPPAAVTGASSWLTGRIGGSNNTDLGFINFAAAHGFNAGDIVAISGSVNAALNGTFKVVDVPSATQIAVYADSVNAIGTAGAPIADAAISVQLKPTLHVLAIGDDYAF